MSGYQGELKFAPIHEEGFRQSLSLLFAERFCVDKSAGDSVLSEEPKTYSQ
jgi:hypothetical protein